MQPKNYNKFKPKRIYIYSTIFKKKLLNLSVRLYMFDFWVYLVGCLIGIVNGDALSTAKEQHSGARVLVVNGANMQRCVPGSIVAVHVSAVEQQVLQVLDETVATGLFFFGFDLIFWGFREGSRILQGDIWYERTDLFSYGWI